MYTELPDTQCVRHGASYAQLDENRRMCWMLLPAIVVSILNTHNTRVLGYKKVQEDNANINVAIYVPHNILKSGEVWYRIWVEYVQSRCAVAPNQFPRSHIENGHLWVTGGAGSAAGGCRAGAGSAAGGSEPRVRFGAQTFVVALGAP
eukprot:gene22334-biopygen7929